MKKGLLLICLLAFCPPSVLKAQKDKCYDFTCNINRAKTALKSENYDEALAYAKAAKAYPNKDVLNQSKQFAEADALIDAVFKGIKAQKQKAIDERKRADLAKAQAIGAFQQADSAKVDALKSRDEANREKAKSDALYKKSIADNQRIIALNEVNKQNAKSGYEDFLQTIKDGKKLNAHLLCIGIDKYQYDGYVLPGCVNDAKSIDSLFEQQKGQLFVNINAHLLLDSQATKKNILTALNDIVSVSQKNDLVIIHYSGGGTQDTLFPYDVKYISKRDTTTFIYGDTICRILLKSKSNVLFIYDTQHGEDFFSALVDSNKNSLDHKILRNKILILGASSKGQTANEIRIDGVSHGILTHALLYGLGKKQADKDTNGVIYLDEMFSFAEDFMGEKASRQTPFVLIPPTIQNMPLYQYRDTFSLPLGDEIDLIKKAEDKKRIYEIIVTNETINIDSFKTLSFQDIVKVLNHNIYISDDTIKKIATLKILIDTLLKKNKDLKFNRFTNPNPFKHIARLYTALGNKDEAQKYEQLYAELDTTSFDHKFLLAQKDLMANRFDDSKKKVFELMQKDNSQELVQAFAKNKGTHTDYERMESLLKATFPSYNIAYFRNQLVQLQDSLPHTLDSLQIYNHFIDTLNQFVKIDTLRNAVYPELMDAYFTQAKLEMVLGKIQEAQVATKYYYQTVDSTLAKNNRAVAGIELFYAALFKNRTQENTEMLNKYITDEVQKKYTRTEYITGEVQHILNTMAVFDNEQIVKQSDIIRVKLAFGTIANLEKIIDQVNEKIENETDTSKILSLYATLLDTLVLYFQKDTTNGYSKNRLIETTTSYTEIALLTQQFKTVENITRMCLQVDSENKVSSINLAHALLFQGKYEEALKHYIGLKGDDENAESNIENILSDFDEFESNGIISKEREKDVAAIRKLLEKKE